MPHTPFLQVTAVVLPSLPTDKDRLLQEAVVGELEVSLCPDYLYSATNIFQR